MDLFTINAFWEWIFAQAEGWGGPDIPIPGLGLSPTCGCCRDIACAAGMLTQQSGIFLAEHLQSDIHKLLGDP